MKLHKDIKAFAAVLMIFFGQNVNAQNETTEGTPNYLSVVKQYADKMIKDGRDNYGDEQTPLFASVLNRKTLKLDEALESIEIPGVRESDRAITGANMIHDIDLYQILDQLTTITEERKYANEADKALEYFLTNCQTNQLQVDHLLCINY